MMIKEIKAALAKVARSGLDKLQAGARSTQGNTLNYASVNTLDPSRLASGQRGHDRCSRGGPLAGGPGLSSYVDMR